MLESWTVIDGLAWSHKSVHHAFQLAWKLTRQIQVYEKLVNRPRPCQHQCPIVLVHEPKRMQELVHGHDQTSVEAGGVQVHHLDKLAHTNFDFLKQKEWHCLTSPAPLLSSPARFRSSDRRWWWQSLDWRMWRAQRWHRGTGWWGSPSPSLSGLAALWEIFMLMSNMLPWCQNSNKKLPWGRKVL